MIADWRTSAAAPSCSFLLLPAPSCSLWSRFDKIFIQILTMPPNGGRKAPVKTVGKKIGRRSVPCERAWCGFLVLPFQTRKKRWWTLLPQSNAAIIPCANAPRFSDGCDDCILCAAGKEEAEGCTSPSIRWAAWRHVQMAQEPWLYIYIKGRSRYKEAAHKRARLQRHWPIARSSASWGITSSVSLLLLESEVAFPATSTYNIFCCRTLGVRTHRLWWRHCTSSSGRFPANRDANSAGKWTTAYSGASSSATDPSESETPLTIQKRYISGILSGDAVVLISGTRFYCSGYRFYCSGYRW